MAGADRPHQMGTAEKMARALITDLQAQGNTAAAAHVWQALALIERRGTPAIRATLSVAERASSP